MCASLIDVIRAGPPPPKVALLPDGSFFTRVLPVAADASPTDVSNQVELQLEALSPFPLTQLYYGYYWKPGADRAFAFAAYRRRFTTEQTDAWKDAELVIPAFAALFGAEVAPATTVVLSAPEGLTGVHWTSGAGPSQVIFRPFSPEPTDEEKTKVRDDLLRAIGGSRAIIDLPTPPVASPAKSDDEIVFTAGSLTSKLESEFCGALDVRDKGQLATLRAAKARDVWVWRSALACVAALLLLAVGEATVFGGSQFWQKTRNAKLTAQRPTVDKILTAQTFAARIEERATRRLLPFEMITVVSEKKPASIQFIRTTTNGIDTLVVDAQTNNAGEIGLYETALKNLPVCEKVEIKDQRGAGDSSTFQLVVAFKSGALQPSVL